MFVFWLSLLFLFGLLHKLCVVNDKALLRAFADEPRVVIRLAGKYESAAVDFDQLRFAANRHANGRCGEVLYVNSRADR